MTATRRRPGVTLMEVLLATFIMAVGMLAIMALFPIGAVNFARAINQDRAATHGVNADNTFRFYWKQAWNERNPPFLGEGPAPLLPPSVAPKPTPPWAPVYGPPTGSYCATTEAAYQNSQEPMILFLEAHPHYGPISGNGFQPGLTTQPSFPVLVDPVGWQTNSGDLLRQGYVGYSAEMQAAGERPRFPVRTTLRRAINSLPYRPHTPPEPASIFPRPTPIPTQTAVTPGMWPFPLVRPGLTYWNHPVTPLGAPPYQYFNQSSSIRLTTLLDDMTFAQSNDTANTPAQYVAGEPATPTAQLERGGRYTASWLIQRNRNDAPGEVNLHVLVFSGRSPTDTPSAETALQAVTAPGTKSILVDLAGKAPPAIRRGGWIAFSMEVGAPPHQPQPGIVPYPTLDFYRVTAVDDTTTPGSLIVEVETTVKTNGPTTAPPNPVYRGYAIVFDNLVEVFDRGIVTPTGHAVK